LVFDGPRKVSSELQRYGFMVESDPKLPSVVSLIAGEPVIGSWWGHPKGRIIWRFLNDLAARRDVLRTKLVSGKVTFVHETLWPSLFVLCISGEGWQTEGLSKSAAILRKMTEEGMTTTLEAMPRLGKQASTAALELERRLLVQSEQFHTDRGFHAKRLRTWEEWSRGIHLAGTLPSVSSAKVQFESRLKHLNQKFGGNGRLPWV